MPEIALNPPPFNPVWEKGVGGMLTGVDFLASPCVPSPVSGIRTPKHPLLPLWEMGVGGMRGKGARECKTSLISPKNSTLESRGMKGQRVLRITLPITLEPAWHQSRTIPVITENHAHPGSAGVPNREPRTENREPRAPWERGRPEPRTKNREPRTTCILGARAVPPACGDCGLMEIEHSIRYALLLWG